MVRLPFTGYPRERLTVSSPDGLLAFRAHYSSESESWFLDILRASIEDGDEEFLLAGRRVAVGLDLIEGLGLRIGAVVCSDNSVSGVDPGQKELGDRVVIDYYTQGELESGAVPS